MNTRRNFFKQLVGQIVVISDELHGIEHVPLNRLKELPDHVIKKIEPVFFPEENWKLHDRILFSTESKLTKSFSIELNEIERQAFGYFNHRLQLEEIAFELTKSAELPFHDVYQIVTALFFKLASLRVCHPREVYSIDELTKEII